MQYTIQKIPLDPVIKRQLNIADFIDERSEKDDIIPYQRAVMQKHAAAIREYQISKFVFDNLTGPLAEKIKYTHHIDIQDNDMFLMRDDTLSPGILEKMRLNFNFNTNPPNHDKENKA